MGFRDTSAGGGIQRTIFDAAGELLVGTGDDTFDTVPAPVTEGQQLYARLAETIRMRWETPPAPAPVVERAFFDAAGELLVGTGNDALDNLPAPTAEGQQLFARLGQPMRMAWEAPVHSVGIPTFPVLRTDVNSLDSTFAPVRCYKNQEGWVHATGLVRNQIGGTIAVGGAVVTFPLGFRPNTKHLFITSVNGALGVLQIALDGVVTYLSGSWVNGSDIYLSPISFPVT